MTLKDLPELGHVGYMCEDVDHFAQMFGEDRVRVYDFSPTRAWAYGEPIDAASCKLRIALYSPEHGAKQEFVKYVSGDNMAHKEFMDKHGEGIHHIAFNVDDTDAVVKVLTEEYGAVVEQHGIYGDGSGQYTYLNAQENLKCRIELLESFRK